MRCTEAQPLLSSYLDRAVSGTEMHELSGHLDQCTDCQKEYVLLENTQYFCYLNSAIHCNIMLSVVRSIN